MNNDTNDTLKKYLLHLISSSVILNFEIAYEESSNREKKTLRIELISDE